MNLTIERIFNTTVKHLSLALHAARDEIAEHAQQQLEQRRRMETQNGINGSTELSTDYRITFEIVWGQVKSQRVADEYFVELSGDQLGVIDPFEARETLARELLGQKRSICPGITWSALLCLIENELVPANVLASHDITRKVLYVACTLHSTSYIL